MKTRRLGRGLKEVSEVFLSSEAASAYPESSRPESASSPLSENPHPSPIHAIGITEAEDKRISLFILCNIAVELARQGYRVLVVDDDPGAFNVSRLMGLPEIENHVENILINAPMGVRLAYRTPFLNDLASTGKISRSVDPPLWPERYRRFDLVLVHVAGRSLDDLGAFLNHLSLCIAVSPPDPRGMLQTYTILKELHQRNRKIQMGVIIQTEEGEAQAEKAFSTIARNAKKFLRRNVISYSFLPKEKIIDESIREKTPLVLKWTSSETRKHLYGISELIIEDYEQKFRLSHRGSQ